MSIKHLLAGLMLCLPFHVLCEPEDSVRIAANNPQEEIDDLTLEQLIANLPEVVVKGSRPMVKIKEDGFMVRISSTYLANSGTALDLLGKIPFVTRDGSQLEVIGKGKPLIYLNGRQIRDFSEVEQLPSSQIKNVEVITNPGARYASTVNAVIRITTVSPVGEGFSASDRTTVGYKHYAYLFEQLNLNYRKYGLDLFAVLNYENYRERPAFDNITTQYLASGTVTSVNKGRELSKYPVYQGKAGFNYNLAGHNFGMYYDFSYRPADINSWSETERFVNSVPADNLTQSVYGYRQNRQHLLSAYYTGSLGKWTLSANFDAIWQINGKTTDEQERSAADESREFSTRNQVYNRLLAGNAIASMPLWKGNLRFGSEISNIFRTDRYSSNAEFISDNDTKINESTYGLFAEASQSFGIVELSAGVRWEYTDTEYYLFGQKQNDQSRHYSNFAPSASISLPIGKVNTRLNYSRKTSRPAFEQLSSAVRYIDRYNFESGNPNLRPIYRDYLSLSASWNELVVELDFTSTENYFMWQTAPYPGAPGVTLLTMRNMPRFSSFSAMASYTPAIGCWRPNVMAAVEYQDFRLVHNGIEMKLDSPLGIFRLNNAFHLPLDIWLNVDFSARTSGNGDNFYLKSTWHCDVGLFKSFCNDTWSIKLQLNDLFDTRQHEFISYDALSRIAVRKIFDNRDLSLTIRYDFNASRSRYRGRGAGNSEKSRL